MASSALPLIVGAGPVGLAAGLFLARNGVRVRLIERELSPSPYSKALAVNPRTLDLLQDVGITTKMLEIGKPIHRGCFWQEGSQSPLTLQLSKLEHRYPFLLALSQGVTVRLLEEAFVAAGGVVERGVEMVSCVDDAAGPIAQIRKTGDAGGSESVQCPWIFSADGAHSVGRRVVGGTFEGSSFAQPWHLVDVPLKTDLDESAAHIVLFKDGGFCFCLRVVGDTADDPAAPLWRLLSDHEDPIKALSRGEAVGPVLWSSSFHIVHRIVEHMQGRHIFLAGDSAHLHSPVGARGMNLGIEDAYVFARCVSEGRLDQFNALRRPVDHGVVKRIEFISRMAVGASAPARIARRHLLPIAMSIPMVSQQMLETVSGLDHALGVGIARQL